MDEKLGRISYMAFVRIADKIYQGIAFMFSTHLITID